MRHEAPFRLTAAIGILALLAACATQSGTTYLPGETGAAFRVTPARVVSARAVTISGLDDRQAAGWGTLVGAALAGTAAYGITEADNPAGVAITVIAALVGGLAGLAGEEFRRTRRGAEYVLEDERGENLAVVQAIGRGEAILSPGTPVQLLYGRGGYLRVVPAA